MPSFTKPKKKLKVYPIEVIGSDGWWATRGGMPAEDSVGAATRPPPSTAVIDSPGPGDASVALLFLTIKDPKNPGAPPAAAGWVPRDLGVIGAVW